MLVVFIHCNSHGIWLISFKFSLRKIQMLRIAAGLKKTNGALMVEWRLNSSCTIFSPRFPCTALKTCEYMFFKFQLTRKNILQLCADQRARQIKRWKFKERNKKSGCWFMHVLLFGKSASGWRSWCMVIHNSKKKRRLGATRAFFRFCILHPERAKVQKEHHKKLAAVVGSAGKHESGGLISVAAIRFLLIRGSLFNFLRKKTWPTFGTNRNFTKSFKTLM